MVQWKQHLLASSINHNMHTLSPASLESSLWFLCFKRNGSRIGTYFKRNIGRDDLALWLPVCSPHSEMALIKLCNIMAHYMQLKSRDHLFNLVYLTRPAEGCSGMERKERRKWQWPSANKVQTLVLVGLCSKEAGSCWVSPILMTIIMPIWENKPNFRE